MKPLLPPFFVTCVSLYMALLVPECAYLSCPLQWLLIRMRKLRDAVSWDLQVFVPKQGSFGAWIQDHRDRARTCLGLCLFPQGTVLSTPQSLGRGRADKGPLKRVGREAPGQMLQSQGLC